MPCAAGLAERMAEDARAEELAMCARDRRFAYRDVLLGEPASGDPVLGAVDVLNARSLSAAHRSALGLGDDQAGPGTVLGAGLSLGRCVAHHTPESVVAFRDAVAAEVDQALAAGRWCVAPFVTEGLLAGFVRLSGFVAAAVACDDWWTLHLEGLSPQEWVRTRSRRVRQTWVRDRRVAAGLGVQFAVRPADHDTLAPLVDLFAATMRHNGDEVDATMAQWFLERGFELPGTHELVVSTCEGRPVGALLTRSDRTFCHAWAVGTAAGAERWRDLYQVAAYLGALELASVRDVDAIGFGRAHGRPKQIRGCRGEQLFRVDYRKAG